jgi:hypothetical protein
MGLELSWGCLEIVELEMEASLWDLVLDDTHWIICLCRPIGFIHREGGQSCGIGFLRTDAGYFSLAHPYIAWWRYIILLQRLPHILKAFHLYT